MKGLKPYNYERDRRITSLNLIYDSVCLVLVENLHLEPQTITIGRVKRKGPGYVSFNQTYEL